METEAALCSLEESVKRTDTQIDKIVGKIDECEKEVTDMACDEESQENKECVLHLLETVTQVKQNYENLRKELLEVQQLQKQVQHSLRNKTAQVQTNCRALRLKLTSHRYRYVKLKTSSTILGFLKTLHNKNE